VRVTARLIYGLDALVDLAAAGAPVKGELLATRHEVSLGFLENILADLRRAGLVQSKRGGNGGYWLARPAADITVADVMRVLDGAGRAEASVGDHLPSVWHSITAATMAAAESFTLAAMAAERGPAVADDQTANS
jgi:Rrf2 family protein